MFGSDRLLNKNVIYVYVSLAIYITIREIMLYWTLINIRYIQFLVAQQSLNSCQGTWSFTTGYFKCCLFLFPVSLRMRVHMRWLFNCHERAHICMHCCCCSYSLFLLLFLISLSRAACVCVCVCTASVIIIDCRFLAVYVQLSKSRAFKSIKCVLLNQRRRGSINFSGATK